MVIRSAFFEDEWMTMRETFCFTALFPINVERATGQIFIQVFMDPESGRIDLSNRFRYVYTFETPAIRECIGADICYAVRNQYP